MTDDHEKKLRCCSEIEEALVATLDDLRPRMMAKYALDEFDTEEALAMGAIGAGVHLHLRDTFADADNGISGHILFKHIQYMIDGFLMSRDNQGPAVEPDGE